MIRLSREIRFALVPRSKIGSGKANNSWAGWPSTNLIVPHLRLQLIVSGVPDPITGYLCNIKIIDDLLRNIVTHELIPNYDGSQSAEAIIRTVAREVQREFRTAVTSSVTESGQLEQTGPVPIVENVCLHVTPFLRFTIYRSNESEANSLLPSNQPESSHRLSEDMIELTQQFEFSAAHRLHCDSLSDDANVQMFGKCNNPEGHGHNYVVEVSVAANVDSDDGQVMPLDQLESQVKRLVIDRLDHKHLNRDVDYFAEVNPSVENIAAAIFGWLKGEMGNARLTRVKVFETPKTWAEFTELNESTELIE